MAGATQVCHGASYGGSGHPVTPASRFGINSLTATSSTSRGAYWRVPPCPTAAESFDERFAVPRPPAPATAAKVSSPRWHPRALRICPFGLRSQATVRMHITRMLFGASPPTSHRSVFCPVSMDFNILSDSLSFEVVAKCASTYPVCESPVITLLPPTPPTLEAVLNHSPPGRADATKESVKDIHKQQSPAIATDILCEVDGESSSEDEEEDEFDQKNGEYGYESEREDEECVEFSDECSESDSGLHSPIPPRPVNCYVTLFSEESGYCGDESPLTHDEEVEEEDESEWSDEGECSEGESSKADGKTSEELWDQFQLQALSPSLDCRKRCPLRPSAGATSQPTCTVRFSVLRVCSPPPPSSSSNPPSPSRHSQCTGATSACSDIPYTDTAGVNDRSCRQSKHVSFKCDGELAEVHCIVAWNYAYRSARHGPWEQLARDRMHFRRRIDSVAPILESCLSKMLGSRDVT